MFYGSAAGTHLNAPIVGIAASPSGHGYELAGADGGVLTFGDAICWGCDVLPALAAPIVGIVASPGPGYWLVGADGAVLAAGPHNPNPPAGAGFYGSLAGEHLNARIVGMTATPDAHGYWLVGADGGVFSFGDAAFYGSAAATPLAHPMVGMATAG